MTARVPLVALFVFSSLAAAPAAPASDAPPTRLTIFADLDDDDDDGRADGIQDTLVPRAERDVHWFDAGHGSRANEQNIEHQELMMRWAYRVLG